MVSRASSASAASMALTPGRRRPVRRMPMILGTRSGKGFPVIAEETSMPPRPMPSMPSAPQEAVWLSAPISSMPGFARSSAYSVWQMPLPARA